jgi:hypothetical protein
MDNLDKLFEEQETTGQEKQPFDRDEYVSRKKAERDEVYGIIEDATKEMQTSGKLFQEFLDVQARFDRYSVSNATSLTLPVQNSLVIFQLWIPKQRNSRQMSGCVFFMVSTEAARKTSISSALQTVCVWVMASRTTFARMESKNTATI